MKRKVSIFFEDNQGILTNKSPKKISVFDIDAYYLSNDDASQDLSSKVVKNVKIGKKKGVITNVKIEILVQYEIYFYFH